MKPYSRKFFFYLLLFFTLNMIVNIAFKPSLNVGTALSVALGVSAGMVISEYRRDRKEGLHKKI